MAPAGGQLAPDPHDSSTPSFRLIFFRHSPLNSLAREYSWQPPARRRPDNPFDCTQNTQRPAISPQRSLMLGTSSHAPPPCIRVLTIYFPPGPQPLMPLVKALEVDRRTQLAYPSMWRTPKKQDASKDLLHSECDDREPPTLLRGTVTRNDTQKGRPSDRLEQDQFHSVLFPYSNNPRDTFASRRTPLSDTGATAQGFSGVSGSRPQGCPLSPRLRHTSLKRPPSPSLPIVAPTALASCKHHRSESTLTTGFWGDLAENKYINTQEFWLALYFFFNLSLTLYNKVVLVHFPYPYTVTALHALCGTVGGWSLLVQGFFVQKKLSSSDTMALVMFSVLYAMNIAISNVSLNLVTVPVGPISPFTSVCSD